jgi:eukaryotic-like serine/threonine-protein kinase
LRDLLDGKCDAAATNGGNYLTSDQRGIPSARLGILTVTGSSPHAAVVAGSGVPAEVVDAVRGSLYGFDPSRTSVFPTTDGRSITSFMPPETDYPALLPQRPEPVPQPAAKSRPKPKPRPADKGR